MKTLAKTCDFGTLYDELLKDEIVYGINANRVRERSLAEDGIVSDKECDHSG